MHDGGKGDGGKGLPPYGIVRDSVQP